MIYSNISSAADLSEVYYWAGNKPGFKSVTGDTITDSSGKGNNKPNDGWRPLNQKPDGTFDNSVSTVLIGPNKQPNPDNVKKTTVPPTPRTTAPAGSVTQCLVGLVVAPLLCQPAPDTISVPS